MRMWEDTSPCPTALGSEPRSASRERIPEGSKSSHASPQQQPGLAPTPLQAGIMRNFPGLQSIQKPGIAFESEVLTHKVGRR